MGFNLSCRYFFPLQYRTFLTRYMTFLPLKVRLLNGSGVVGQAESNAMDLKPAFQTNVAVGPPKLTPSASSRFQPTNSSAVASATTKRRSLKRPAPSTTTTVVNNKSNGSNNNTNNCMSSDDLQEVVAVTSGAAQTVPSTQSTTTTSALPNANVFLSINNSVKQIGVI